eukprot:Skav229727  [mRNA]  locus=scaffold49:412932:418332:- [translate_table: standard]
MALSSGAITGESQSDPSSTGHGGHRCDLRWSMPWFERGSELRDVQKIYGIRGGYKGVVKPETWMELTPRSVQDINSMGGTILVSDRGNPTEEAMVRHSGFIALHAGLAARNADIVLLPEMTISRSPGRWEQHRRQ